MHSRTARSHIVAVAVMASTVLPTAAAAAATSEEVRSANSGAIDDWVTERLAAQDIPGAAVAVVRDGEIVHLAGYGEAGPADRPVTPDTPFIIGSSSKPFTALVVQQLVAEGRLSLDEAVAPHLQTVTGTVPNGFEDATVGQLLNHTGGLSMMVGLAGTVDVHRGDDALERRVRELMAQQLASQPGGDFEYSNAGAQLLAAVTEQVTGRPFAQSLQERVFDPLGMDRSFAREDDPTAADLATGHARWFGRWRPADFPYDEAGVAMGYIGSTARDLAAFVRAHLDGHPSAVPATADRIAQERVVPTDWDLPLEGGYGLGWFVDEHAGRQVVSHSGSLGHFTAHLIMVPEERLGVAVLSNASAFVANGHEGQYDLSLGITDLLLDRQPTPTEPSALMALAAPGAVWAMVVAVFLAALHQVVRRFPRWRRERRAGAAPRWLRRVVVPDAGWITAAAVLFVAVPLDSGRHFYPDVGWGATVLAFLCLGWAAVRTILTVAALRRPRREGEEDRRSRVGPQAGMRDSRHHDLRAAVTDIVRMRSLRKPRASRSSRRAGQPRPVHTGLGRGTSRR